MLISSYGVYLSTSSSTVYADYFEPDCAPPDGKGPTLDKIVSAGARRVGFMGTAYRVKNCSNSIKQIGAQIKWGTCTDLTTSCAFKNITTVNPVTLPAGEYYTFYAPDVVFTCGSGRTAIIPEGLQEEGFYSMANRACDVLPSPSPSIRPTLTPRPTVTPEPTTVVTQIPSGHPTYTAFPDATVVVTQIPTHSPSYTLTPEPSSTEKPVETPARFSPAPSGCYYKQVQCFQAPCSPVLICPVPTATATATPTSSPSSTPTMSPVPTLTPTPSASPEVTQLKLCKFEDDNADGLIQSGENTLSWTFNYSFNGQNNTVDSHWWHLWTQGCAIVEVPVATNITVNEVEKSGWRPTAIYADGARVDGSSYNYTSDGDSVKVMWFLNTFTPVTSPTPSPSPSVTASPSATASPTASATSTPTPTATASPTESATASPTATASPSDSPTATPSPTDQPLKEPKLKICKFDDQNNDGLLSTGEGTLGWSFNYTIDNQTFTVSRSAWDVIFHYGCLIVQVPAAKSITVSEQARQDWTQTALYADNAKVDGTQYTYTSADGVDKELWFLNHNTPGTTVSPSPTASATATANPTASPTSNTSSYNVVIEKRVDGTRVDGDYVGIQYRIRIKNNGTSRVDSLEVRDTLPPDFTYDSNTTEGDITRNPSIEDVSGDDNRRILWRDIALDGGKEINFGYRTTGKRTDTNFCNDAQVRRNDNIISTSQACTRISQASQTAVLAATTTRTLPATGTSPVLYSGILLTLLAAIGWKLSRHIE